MLRRLAFALALLVSVVMLFSPAAATPEGPVGSDKLVHAALFAVLTWTGLLAGVRVTRLGAGLLAYAVLSELAQALLPIGRQATVGDLFADAIGVFVAGAIARFLRRAR